MPRIAEIEDDWDLESQSLAASVKEESPAQPAQQLDCDPEPSQDEDDRHFQLQL